jgi:hypothetical protein
MNRRRLLAFVLVKPLGGETTRGETNDHEEGNGISTRRLLPPELSGRPWQAWR